MSKIKTTTLPYKELTLEGGGFTNPRQQVDGHEINSLADSIAAQGLHNALHVWQTTDEDGKKLSVVICGSRRYRAIGKLIKKRRANGLNKEVPVRLIDAKTAAEARILALSENIDRKELSSYETAAAIAEMVEAGEKQKDIAKRLGKSQTWVSRQLKSVRNTAEPVQDAWKAGVLPDDTVQDLAKLDSDEQCKRLDGILKLREEAAKVTAKGSARQAKAKAREIAKGKSADKPKPTERKVRPSEQVLLGLVKVAEKATKKEAYVRGLCDGVRFALGDLAVGELSKEWRDFGAKHMKTDAE